MHMYVRSIFFRDEIAVFYGTWRCSLAIAFPSTAVESSRELCLTVYVEQLWAIRSDGFCLQI
jgi:hypothetical protein